MHLRTLRNETGAAAMFAIFMLGTAFALMITALTLIQTAKTLIGRELTYSGQALNAANAGLVDGLGWFRRQTIQPVTSFNPVRNDAATPPVNDTDDASIGVVRDFQISQLGSVWGRYEVRKTKVSDVSTRRGKSNAGTVWLLQSQGIVYVKKDLTKAYNVAPNTVLASQWIRTEIQRMSLVLPANAAICSSRADRVTTQTKSRVLGGSNIGIAYPSSSGTATTAGVVTGSPAKSAVNPYKATIPDVFGVTQQELINMADLVVYSATDLPADIPDMYLTCIRGDATFSSTRPLTGTGIMVVFGNLTISANSYSNWNGLIYVTGNFVQNAPSAVNGSVVVGGTTTLNGSGDFSEATYDGTLLTSLLRQVGQYRFNRNPNSIPGGN